MSAADPILVTGATGFLGTHLCRELSARGREVRAMRRPTSDTDGLEGTDVEWVVGDVLDPGSVREAVAGCGSVAHLAGVGLAAAPPETVREVNVMGTKHVLDAAADAGVESVLFTSTAGTRRSDGIADETDVAEPIGPYQSSKRRAERLAARHVEDGLDVVTVHPTSVFGPGDEEFTGRLLSMASDPKLFASLPGGVSFVGVRDVIEGMIAAMERGRAGEHYVLGGQNLTFPEALSIIVDEAGGHCPRVEVPSLAIRALGHVAEQADERFDKRFFPFSADMARLSTQRMFYSSRKAADELGYDYRPLRELVPDAASWFRTARA